jgi:TonB family protein
MGRVGFAFLILLLTGASASGGQDNLCVKHIESPVYDRVARAAHVAGIVELSVTIDAGGKVVRAERVTGTEMLSRGALENVRRWIFDKPAYAPYTLKVVFEFKFDGEPGETAVSASFFDLPGHVTVAVNPVPVETIESKPKR